MIYETDDTLTLVQAKVFMALVEHLIGVDMELNPSASGEENQYYVMVVDLEGSESSKCALIEHDCKGVTVC